MSSHVESQPWRQPSKVHLCRVVPATNTDDNDNTVGQTWGRVAPIHRRPSPEGIRLNLWTRALALAPSSHTRVTMRTLFPTAGDNPARCTLAESPPPGMAES